MNINGAPQVSGVTQNNFTESVIYTVVAEDGSTQNYTVTVSFNNLLQSDSRITKFSLDGTVGIINGHNIKVIMPLGTSLASLTATFTTTGASVNINGAPQVSGVTQNNFTESVIYTVVAEDGSIQNYNAIVTLDSAFMMVGIDGVINKLTSDGELNNVEYSKVELKGVTVSNDGVYVGVGDYGTIITSTNSTDWTLVKSGISSYFIYGVTVNSNGMFVAVGRAGVILTSTNGTDWTIATSGTTNPIYSVAVDNSGTFVAVGNYGTILTSMNGTDWAIIPALNGVRLNAIITY